MKDAKEWIAAHDNDVKYELRKVQDVEPFENHIYNAKKMMEMIIQESGADEYIVYLSGKDNYRDLVATMQIYKGNRDPSHKPFFYKELKQYLIDEWGGEVIYGCEADDAMSMAQYLDKTLCEDHGFNYMEQAETIICTLDKDLDMVPGHHYNWVRKEKYQVTTITGLRFFYKQMLTGDSTDNIPGLFRLTGQKATKKLLSVIDTLESRLGMWLYIHETYKAGFEKNKGNISDGELTTKLVEIARLLWMSKDEIDDFKVPN